MAEKSVKWITPWILPTGVKYVIGENKTNSLRVTSNSPGAATISRSALGKRLATQKIKENMLAYSVPKYFKSCVPTQCRREWKRARPIRNLLLKEIENFCLLGCQPPNHQRTSLVGVWVSVSSHPLTHCYVIFGRHLTSLSLRSSSV